MNNIEDFFQTQFHKDLPPLLQKSISGIACVYTSLRYFDEELESFPSFVKRYISMSIYNKPTFYMTVPLGKHKLQVPIIYFPTPQKNDDSVGEELIKKIKSEFNIDYPSKKIFNTMRTTKRTFLLQRGIDLRGIEHILKDSDIFDININVLQAKDFPTTLSDQELLLCTLKTKMLKNETIQTEYNPKSLHTIIVYKITKSEEDFILEYIDPSSLNIEDCKKNILLREISPLLGRKLVKIEKVLLG